MAARPAWPPIRSKLATQYWTSRGFAVLDVNYGGSSGFGRAYRDALKGQWGVIDVDDCVAGARHLAARGMVDPERLVIRGGSAGGLTTLCALTFHDVFKAGASYYGVSDLKGLDARLAQVRIALQRIPDRAAAGGARCCTCCARRSTTPTSSSAR